MITNLQKETLDVLARYKMLVQEFMSSKDEKVIEQIVETDKMLSLLFQNIEEHQKLAKRSSLDELLSAKKDRTDFIAFLRKLIFEESIPEGRKLQVDEIMKYGQRIAFNTLGNLPVYIFNSSQFLKIVI